MLKFLSGKINPTHSFAFYEEHSMIAQTHGTEARQKKIDELRSRLIKELRPQAAKEEAIARRLRFKRAVDTRLCIMVDQTLKAILEQEDGANPGSESGDSEA